MIPYSRQYINKKDINSVKKVLKSDFLTQGNVLKKFENRVSQTVNSKYSIAVSNATAGLHLSCLSLNLSPGDFLWTVPNTFVASSNCGLYCGANVDFVDINLDTYNICVKSLKKKLVNSKKNFTLPKILVVVHFGGRPADLKEIKYLSKKYKFKIIEDASHAFGAKYYNSKIGANKYSDITVFSFHPVKIITTAEGGVITTNSKKLAERLSNLRTHGINRKIVNKQKWIYHLKELGFNYKMNEIQAALGISQIQKLKSGLKQRHSQAELYEKLLKGLPLILPKREKNYYTSLHLYVVLIDNKKTKFTRKQLYNYLYKNKVFAGVHYIPVHTQPLYKRLGFKNGDFPVSEEYYSRCISLPLYVGLDKKKQLKVINLLKFFFK